MMSKNIKESMLLPTKDDLKQNIKKNFWSPLFFVSYNFVHNSDNWVLSIRKFDYGM